MYYTIYQITNLVNGKLYIGAHKTKELEDGYMGSGKILIRAIEKYGIENFKKEILEVFDSSKEMFLLEKELVNEEFIERKDTYNLKLGGEGGWDHINKDLRDDIREARRKTCKSIGPDNNRIGNINGYAKRTTAVKLAHEQGKMKYDNFKNMKHTLVTKERLRASAKITSAGAKNSQFGTCWITKCELVENKKIKKNELDFWLNQGWTKGRTMRS